MAARWVDLLIRINYILDQADAALSDADRIMFFTHAIATATRRQARRMPFPVEHPQPGGASPAYRDPTGEDPDSF